jgi:hypothetical protein
VSDQDDKNLLEVVKRNGDFVKHYGRWLGAFLYWLSMRADPSSVPSVGRAGCCWGWNSWLVDQVVRNPHYYGVPVLRRGVILCASRALTVTHYASPRAKQSRRNWLVFWKNRGGQRLMCFIGKLSAVGR